MYPWLDFYGENWPKIMLSSFLPKTKFSKLLLKYICRKFDLFILVEDMKNYNFSVYKTYGFRKKKLRIFFQKLVFF